MADQYKNSPLLSNMDLWRRLASVPAAADEAQAVRIPDISAQMYSGSDARKQEMKKYDLQQSAEEKWRDVIHDFDRPRFWRNGDYEVQVDPNQSPWLAMPPMQASGMPWDIKLKNGGK